MGCSSICSGRWHGRCRQRRMGRQAKAKLLYRFYRRLHISATPIARRHTSNSRQPCDYRVPSWLCSSRASSQRIVEGRSGQPVSLGHVIGHVGNSGNTTVPHLHIQLMDGPDPRRAAALPCGFAGLEISIESTWDSCGCALAQRSSGQAANAHKFKVGDHVRYFHHDRAVGRHTGFTW
jgi:hypothetical protein